MSLLDLIEENIIVIPLKSSSKNGVIRELVDRLKDAGKISDSESVYNSVMEREDKGGTGLERSIAAPHAKTPAVKEMIIAFGISRTGVDFQSIDQELSRLIFLILAPPNQSGPHIALLSEIARMTKSDTFCTQLLSAAGPEQAVKIFRGE